MAPPPSRPWQVEQVVSKVFLPRSRSAAVGLTTGESCFGFGRAEIEFRKRAHEMKMSARMHNRRIAVMSIPPNRGNPLERRIAYYPRCGESNASVQNLGQQKSACRGVRIR